MAELVTTSQPWTLTQLRPGASGPAKVLVLAGAAAPHGRPRKGAIMETTFELRLKESFTAGVRIPTWQHFGDKESPIVLRGRLRDATIDGPGSARRLLYEMKKMCADAIECILRWGSQVTYLVMPTKLKAGHEAASEITYELTCNVGLDYDLVRRVGPPVSIQSPAAMIERVDLSVRNVIDGFNWLAALGALVEDFLNGFADLVSTFNSVSAFLLHAVEFVQDFESALIGDIQRLSAGIGQFKTLVNDMVDLVDNAVLDATLVATTADAYTRYQKWVAGADVMRLDVLGVLADLEDGIQNLGVGGAVPFRAIIARDGDTWESIAQRELGSASAAGSIMDTNQIQGAEKPVPGKSYLIPQ